LKKKQRLSRNQPGPNQRARVAKRLLLSFLSDASQSTYSQVPSVANGNEKPRAVAKDRQVAPSCPLPLFWWDISETTNSPAGFITYGSEESSVVARSAHDPEKTSYCLPFWYALELIKLFHWPINVLSSLCPTNSFFLRMTQQTRYCWKHPRKILAPFPFSVCILPPIS
jgi:hypothetical protein